MLIPTTAPPPPPPPPSPVSLLILGAGWTSTHLIPLLTTLSIPHAATTRSGSPTTIPFTYDPTSPSPTPYTHLPRATTILITFPLHTSSQPPHLLSLYRSIHGPHNNWILLGSTGIYHNPSSEWNDESSGYDRENSRAQAEDEMMRLGGCVLSLAGLYDWETRDPRRWVAGGRVAKSKEEVRAKGAVHLVHGVDVSWGVVGVWRRFEEKDGGEGGVRGKRWIVTDLRVYDWYDLVMSWGAGERGEGEGEGEREKKWEFTKWVGELMREEGVRALPRGEERLGRKLDGRAFWEMVGMWPSQGRVG